MKHRYSSAKLKLDGNDEVGDPGAQDPSHGRPCNTEVVTGCESTFTLNDI